MSPESRRILIYVLVVLGATGAVKAVSDESARSATVDQEQDTQRVLVAACERNNLRFRQASRELVRLGGAPVPMVRCSAAYPTEGGPPAPVDVAYCETGRMVVETRRLFHCDVSGR